MYYYEGSNNRRDYVLQRGNMFTDLCTPKNRLIFREILQHGDWQQLIYSSSDVNVGFNTLLTVLLHSYETSFVLIRQSKKACLDRRWITSSLKISSVKKKL